MEKRDKFLKDLFDATKLLKDGMDVSWDEFINSPETDKKEIYQMADAMLDKGWAIITADDIDKAIHSFQGPIESWSIHIAKNLKGIINGSNHNL